MESLQEAKKKKDKFLKTYLKSILSHFEQVKYEPKSFMQPHLT